MRNKLHLLAVFFFISCQLANAQTPQSIPYQAVARDAAGNLLVSKSVCVQFRIYNAPSGGSLLYVEHNTATTNTLGLFTLNVGQGTPDAGGTYSNLSGITWGSTAAYMEVGLDLTNSCSGYVTMGRTQMLSVPYALYAASAGNTTNTLGSSTNTITSTVNGVAATAPAVNSVSNTSSTNNLSTTVNGVAGTGVNIINSNTLTQNSSNQLVSTLNGIGATALTVGITGDVTGNLDASTLAKIQGTPVTITSLTNGNILQYNSSVPDWVNVSPASAANGTFILNQSTQQASSNYNISGNGIVGTDLGIGTTPATILDVLSGNNWGLTTGNGDARIGATVSSVPYYLKIGIATSGSGAGDAYIASTGGGTSRLFLGSVTSSQTSGYGYSQTLTLQGGNVGIGNISPTTLLEVGNGGSTGKAVIYSEDNSNGQLQVANPTSSGEASMGFISGATGIGDAYASTNGTSYIWDIGAGNWAIGGNKFGIGNQGYGGVIMTLTSTGYVGIGTSSPQTGIDVEKALSATYARFGTSNPLYIVADQPMVGFNILWNSGYTYGSSSYGGLINFNQELGGGFNILTAATGTAGGAATMTSRMVITNAGSVGIGTTTPGNLLDVEGGNIDASGYVMAGGTGGGSVLFSGTNGASVTNSAWGAGGCSFYGRPRIGDFGEWLEVGEPNGTNGGEILQVQGTGIYTGTSTGLTVAPTLRNTLDNGSGRMGLGTTAPGYQLTLAGGGTSAVFGIDNGDNFVAKNSSGNYDTYLWPRWTDNIMYLNYGSSGFNIRNNSSATTMFMNNSGYVGIGTTNPAVPLDIQTDPDFNEGSYGWLNSGGNTSTASCSSCPVSFRAVGRVMGAEFDATSDRRIKTDIVHVTAQSSLELAQKLQVVHYNYIDKVAKGNVCKTGFIAQEVEATMPNAVNKTVDFIPNVYAPAAQLKLSGNTLTVTTHQPNGFTEGDQIRLLDKKNQIHEVTITGIESPTAFKINDWNGDVDTLFVYGKKVNDLRSVDFDQITAVAIGAVQELNKKVEALEKENAQLKDDNCDLNEKISAVSSATTNIELLQKKLDYLQQLMEKNGLRSEK